MEKKLKKIALVRGKFLNAYEMQIFEPLVEKYQLTAFGSLYPYHDAFAFPVVKLPSPMDIPDFPYKMPVLNRICTDAHYLFGLEENLKGYDLVHTAETYFHYTKQALYAKKKGYVKKVIATVLENIPFNNEGIWRRKEFKKNAREHLDHIIALTNRSKETLLLEGANEKKITVISHGINTKRFFPKNSFLKEQSKNKKNFTILFSGRFETYKGIYEIMYAAKLLLNDTALKEYQLLFLFVGDGSEKQNLIELANKLGISTKVSFFSATYHQMPEIYQQADLFWAPSKPTATYQEQYCTALLEAQAAGLPIVTTFSGGIPENIGDAGVIVGPGDFYSLGQAMREFILLPNKRVGFAKNARVRAEKVHDTRIIAAQMAKVYEKVLHE